MSPINSPESFHSPDKNEQEVNQVKLDTFQELELCQLKVQFDNQLKNTEWIETLSDNEFFSKAELKRVGFLLNLVAYVVEKKSDFLQELSLDTSSFSEAVKKLLSADINEQSAQEIRNALVEIESTLEKSGEKANALNAEILHTREKVGLVLGGGGLTGFMHIGVLKVFEENGIPVNMISGVSMGALVGAFATAFVDEKGQIDPAGIAYITELAQEIKTLDQLKEKRNGKNVLPLDKLLDVNGYSYEEFLKKKPHIPYFAQVKRKSDGEVFFGEPADKNNMQDVLDLAQASSANKQLLELDSVKIGDEEYSDDISTWYKSTDPGIEKLGQEGASVIVDVPISVVDFDWSWIRHIKNFFSSVQQPDKEYVRIRPFEGRGFFSGGDENDPDATLTTTGKGEYIFGVGGKQFAKNQAELDDPNSGKIAIPIEDYLKAGEDAARRELPRILAKLGLRKITKEFFQED